MQRKHLGFIDFDYRPAKGGSAPAAPNPYEVSAAQTQSNQQNAQFNSSINNGNVTTPWGNSTFNPRRDQNTGAIVYDQTINLDPKQQELLDVQNQQDLSLGNLSNALVDQASQNYSKPIDTSGLPAIQGAPQDVAGSYKTSIGTDGLPALNDLSGFNTEGLPELLGANDLQGARQQIQDALYQREASYLDPQYKQREQALQSRLAAQGITQNSEAWNNATDELGRSRSFDYGRARESAITGGLNEMTGLSDMSSRNRGQLFGERQATNLAQATAASSNRAQLYGERETDANLNNTAYSQQLAEALQRVGLNNNARAQGLNEQMALREAPMNELNAIRGATSVAQPQFEGAANVSAAPTDVAGNINNEYQSRLNVWNGKQESSNGLLTGLMGMAGTVGGGLLGGPFGAVLGAKLASKVSGG